MTPLVVKIGQKIGTFISDFRPRRTPGPGKINDFTNKKIFLLKEANAQNHNLCLKTHSSSRNQKIRFFSISRVTKFIFLPVGATNNSHEFLVL